MGKRIIIISLFVLLVSCGKETVKTSSLLSFVPPNTAAMIKSDDFSDLQKALENNSLLNENPSLPIADFFYENLAILKHLNLSDEALICYTKNGRDDYGFTLITKQQSSLINTDSIADKKVETFTYDEKTVHHYALNGKKAYGTQLNDVFILSDSNLVLENIIRIFNNQLPGDEALAEMYGIAGNNESSLFINHEHFTDIYQALLPKASKNSLKNASEWTAVDLHIEEHRLQFNGISKNSSKKPKLIDIFKDTDPQKNQLAQIAPLSATGVFAFTYGRYETLKANLSTYREKQVPELDNEALLESAKEIGVIYADDQAVVVLNAIDPSITEESLLNSKEIAQDFRGVSIYQFTSPNLFYDGFYPLITQKNLAYYAVIDHFFVFAENKASIELIIANYQNRSVLGNQGFYEQSISQLSDEASLLFLGINKNLMTKVAELSEEKHSKSLANLKLDSYELSALQFIYDQDFAHVNALIEKASASSSATGSAQLTSIQVDEALASRPWFVKNWRTGTEDIAVQGVSNTLYVFDYTGKLLWKKPLEGRILGDIQQIDIYGNTRQQLIFATPNQLHIIDRNGGNVDPFPKSFQQPITQPVAVFDYSNNHKYRFVVTQGKQVNMYDKHGKLVKGFDFTAKAPISRAPKHIRIGTKDYIVICEEGGDLNILNRRGEVRVPIKKDVSFSDNDWYLYQDLFTSTTAEGKLIQLTESGKRNLKDLGLSATHHIDATPKTLVSFSENTLTIKGKKIELDFGLYTQPKITYIDNKLYISITDTQAHKVYVFDSQANLLKGFPVYGNSMISLRNMDNKNGLEFCVQGEDNRILIYALE